jgi:hypothetical protein
MVRAQDQTLSSLAAWPGMIVQAVMFALTNTFLTGQTLHIDGGQPLT